MLGGLVDGRLVAGLAMLGAMVAPLDSFVDSFSKYEGTLFVGVLVAFVIVSYIGTRVVLRCGELPANDELFNLRELTPAQQAALRGDHTS